MQRASFDGHFKPLVERRRHVVPSVNARMQVEGPPHRSVRPRTSSRTYDTIFPGCARSRKNRQSLRENSRSANSTRRYTKPNATLAPASSQIGSTPPNRGTLKAHDRPVSPAWGQGSLLDEP